MKRIVIFIVASFAFVLLAGAAFIGWLVWQHFNVPLYTFAQQIAPDGNFANSFLSSNGVRYVSTRTEFSLELVPTTFGYPLIGRTMDQQDIRAVPGNDDYVSYSGFMNPALIFRKEGVPPVDLSTLPVEEIYYAANRGGQRVQKSSRDPKLIAEVTGAMQAAPSTLPSFSEIYHLELHSPELPGLVYSIYVIFDSSGQVYLAPLREDQHGVPAGPLFTEWISQ